MTAASFDAERLARQIMDGHEDCLVEKCGALRSGIKRADDALRAAEEGP